MTSARIILFILLFFSSFNISEAAKKTDPAPTKPLDNLNEVYFVSLDKNLLTLEKQGKQMLFQVTEETSFKVGMETFPRKYLKAGLGIVMPKLEPGSTLSEVEVTCVFKREKKGKNDKTTDTAETTDPATQKDLSVYFTAFDEDVITVEVGGRNQLQRINEFTTFTVGIQTVGRNYIKKGMKLILSNTIPWGQINDVKIIPIFKPTAEGEVKEEEVIPDTINWYFLSLEDRLLTLENNEICYFYLTGPETNFRIGKEEVPRKILTPGMKVLMPAGDPGAVLTEISIIPVFKKDTTAKTELVDGVNMTDESEWTFNSLSDDGMLYVEKEGIQQICRVDDKTLFEIGNSKIKKEYLKKGMRVMLSSIEPWAIQTSIKLVPLMKKEAPSISTVTTSTTTAKTDNNPEKNITTTTTTKITATSTGTVTESVSTTTPDPH